MENPATQNASAKRGKPFYRQLRFWVIVLIAEIIVIFFQHLGGNARHTTQPPPLSVVIAPVQRADVPVYLSALGSVTPTYNVTVKTQVSGQLLRVLFQEGQWVKTGDLLAEIDPRPFQAQLLQYQGQLERDQALLKNARLDLQRYQTLWKQNAIAKQTLDTQTSLVAQYEGNVKLDEGLLATAKVNLIYTKITSPIDGRAGLRLVDPGNVVQPSDAAGLVVINRLNPITVVFTLPEDRIPEVIKQMNTGAQLTVNAFNRNQQTLLAKGTLLTLDNQIDPATGTVKLKALFHNEDNLLFPEQFVNVQLLLKTLHHATVVPTAALQHGAQGTFVFLLNHEQNAVSAQAVATDVTFGEKTVITAGLKEGQWVVVEGADKLTDGSTVTATLAATPSTLQRRVTA